MIAIFNSLSGQKEIFQPLIKNQVGLYVCGVTVYDLCHIGHARTYTVFDTFVRYLRWQGYQVTYVRNITDIDDKIIKRAAESGRPVEAVVDQNVIEMYADFDALGLLRPDIEPRATAMISPMINLIQVLIDKGMAYVGRAGDVYYEVAAFKEYGKLSKQNLAALQAGSRIEVAADKKSPLDFVLWKTAKPGEPAWSSPWGKGRPGWHIECSAMTESCLGKKFDIHGGGSDLRFPHHENEIAQSEGAHAGHFANYWMHSGMVQVNNEKMSKSLGNFFVIRDVLKLYPAEVVRYFLLSAHYRSEISYSAAHLNAAQTGLTRLYNALRGIKIPPETNIMDEESDTFCQSFIDQFIAALNDDLNTPVAFAILFDVAREINHLKTDVYCNTKNIIQFAVILKRLGAVLGLLQEDPEQFLQADVTEAEMDYIESMIATREQARSNKNFAESDRIRDTLKIQGIELEDQKEGGTSWRKVQLIL